MSAEEEGEEDEEAEAGELEGGGDQVEQKKLHPDMSHILQKECSNAAFS